MKQKIERTQSFVSENQKVRNWSFLAVTDYA